MTRINLIDPKFLCDSHLLAEHRELTRIPNQLVSGKYKIDSNKISPTYILGTGHINFFLNKIDFLFERYLQLHCECLSRNFAVTWKFPPLLNNFKHLENVIYKPTKQELSLNKARLIERTPRRVLFNSTEITQLQYIQIIMNEKVFTDFSPF